MLNQTSIWFIHEAWVGVKWKCTVGYFLRHATYIDVDNVQFSYKEADARRTVVLEDIQGGRVRDVTIHSPGGTPIFTSFDTAGLRIKDLSWMDTMSGPGVPWQEFKISANC